MTATDETVSNKWLRAYRRAVQATAGISQNCKCDLATVQDRDQLTAIGAGCGNPWFVCPRLDAVRRRMWT